MALSHLWHPWPARNWPALSHEEETFVQELRSFGEPQSKDAERGDYSILLDALRCGLDLTTLREYLPGVNPQILLWVYEDLEKRRRCAVEAWRSVEEAPTLDAFIESSAKCSSLLSLAVSRVLPYAIKASEESFQASVKSVMLEMSKASKEAAEVESQLHGIERPSEQGVLLGRTLYNPYNPGLWGSPYFVPPRVGTLTPVRVRSLLGESIR